MTILVLGIFTVVRFEQPENAPLFMDVTDSGIVMDVRPVQFLKAFSSIVVTELGIVMEVRPEQP